MMRFIPSISSVKPKLLVLYLGVACFDNKRQEDFIIQAWEQQRVLGNKTWLFL